MNANKTIYVKCFNLLLVVAPRWEQYYHWWPYHIPENMNEMQETLFFYGTVFFYFLIAFLTLPLALECIYKLILTCFEQWVSSRHQWAHLMWCTNGWSLNIYLSCCIYWEWTSALQCQLIRFSSLNKNQLKNNGLSVTSWFYRAQMHWCVWNAWKMKTILAQCQWKLF